MPVISDTDTPVGISAAASPPYSTFTINVGALSKVISAGFVLPTYANGCTAGVPSLPPPQPVNTRMPENIMYNKSILLFFISRYHRSC